MECRRIIGPSAPCSLIEQAWSVGTKQRVRLHRHRGQPVPRLRQCRRRMASRRHNLRPDGSLLQRIQHQPALRVALLPFPARKTLPIQNSWSYPGTMSLGEAAAVVGSPNRARRTIACSYHGSAIAQPCVDFDRLICSHSSVIPPLGGYRQAARGAFSRLYTRG